MGVRDQACAFDTWSLILGQEHPVSVYLEWISGYLTFSQRAQSLWGVVPLLAILTQTTKI